MFGPLYMWQFERYYRMLFAMFRARNIKILNDLGRSSKSLIFKLCNILAQPTFCNLHDIAIKIYYLDDYSRAKNPINFERPWMNVKVIRIKNAKMHFGLHLNVHDIAMKLQYVVDSDRRNTYIYFYKPRSKVKVTRSKTCKKRIRSILQVAIRNISQQTIILLLEMFWPRKL